MSFSSFNFLASRSSSSSSSFGKMLALPRLDSSGTCFPKPFFVMGCDELDCSEVFSNTLFIVDKYVSGNKMVSAGDVDHSSGGFESLPEYALVSTLTLELDDVLLALVLSLSSSLFFFSEI